MRCHCQLPFQKEEHSERCPPRQKCVWASSLQQQVLSLGPEVDRTTVGSATGRWCLAPSSAAGRWTEGRLVSGPVGHWPRHHLTVAFRALDHEGCPALLPTQEQSGQRQVRGSRKDLERDLLRWWRGQCSADEGSRDGLSEPIPVPRILCPWHCFNILYFHYQHVLFFIN